MLRTTLQTLNKDYDLASHTAYAVYVLCVNSDIYSYNPSIQTHVA